jgi:hypothetical protein
MSYPIELPTRFSYGINNNLLQLSPAEKYSKGGEKLKQKMILGLLGIVLFTSIFGAALSHSALSSRNGSDAAPTANTFTVTIPSASWWWTEDDLYNLTDRDTFHVNVTKTCTFTLMCYDGYLIGDTIGIYYPNPNTLVKSAKSPGIIYMQVTLNPGFYTFYVGYVACPMGFPAGYYIWMSGQ